MVRNMIAISALIVGLAACASAASTQKAESEVSDPRKGEEVRSLCFTSSIDGFGETTRRSIVVSKGTKDYLIETYGTCFDLDHANSIYFDSTTSCLSRGDDIYAFNSAFGLDRDDRLIPACKVKSIYTWDKDAAEESEIVETEDEETETLETSISESEVEDEVSEETEAVEDDAVETETE